MTFSFCNLSLRLVSLICKVMFHILKTHTEHISMCQKLFPDLDTRERSNPELSAGNYLSISPENIRLTFKMHDFGTRHFVITIYFYVILPMMYTINKKCPKNMQYNNSFMTKTHLFHVLFKALALIQVKILYTW